ncbi:MULTISPECIES: ATP-binding protein [Curtobacterium]|jgi:serine/threonine-protein kinase RsbW|uniref:ATP-binding protein n=1 Tax=Curtobacterium citri TaxID=3055139 RepID=A0ABT7T5S7_9MICO|nr:MULTISPECIES: ATP-binding protein [Curtobacterium]MDM7884935.1 ATP-binding protein [Curtobacterium citri]
MTVTMGEHVLDLACPPEDVTAVHAFLSSVWDREPDLSVEDRMALELALVELASNVIEHGAAGSRIACSMRFAVRPDDVVVTMVDDGVPVSVDPSAAHLPDAMAEGGRGLALVQMVVDDLRYERVDGRNQWVVRRGRH